MQIWNFGDKIEEQSALINSIGIKFKMILKLRDLKNVKVSNFFSKGFFFGGGGRQRGMKVTMTMNHNEEA